MATPLENHVDMKQLSPVVVVMVPFPAQSHLNQLLQLSHVVSSSYGIPIHYVGSDLHNSQVKSRSLHPNHNHDDFNKIHFHGFSIPSLASPPPNRAAKTKFPEHLIPIFEASKQLRQPVGDLLRALSSTAQRFVVIHDVLMSYVVQDANSLPNAEAYAFNCGSAFFTFAVLCELFGGRNDVGLGHLPSTESLFPSTIRDFFAFQFDPHQVDMRFQAGELHNTSRSIEGPYLELLRRDEKKLWAVGPLHPMTTVSKEKKSINGDRDKCLYQWLDKQEPNTVLYVSFGTTTTLSDEEIEELAVGLEQSGAKFIWVLRDADKVDVFSEEEGEGRGRPKLPDGFEERMKEMGMVVREWAPQLEILGHPSTGGFMSHCGWNSCVESISMGVPIAAWPMHSDQPLNAALITEVLKVGVSVMEWDQRHELVSSSMISQAVRKLMASDEGDEIRKRTKEMREIIKQSIAQGGACPLELESFIAHITR